MSRKYKYDPVLKVELVERYLRNEIGVREAASDDAYRIPRAFQYSGIKEYRQPDNWLTVKNFLIIHCPLDGKHTRPEGLQEEGYEIRGLSAAVFLGVTSSGSRNPDISS